MRSPTLFLSLFLLVPVFAQQQVKISDARILDNPEQVRKSRGAEAALQAVGVTAEQMAQVLTYGDTDH